MRKAKPPIIVARLDRVSRDVHFVSGLMEHKVSFTVADLGTDTRPVHAPNLRRARREKAARDLRPHQASAGLGEGEGNQLGGLRDHGRELKAAAIECAKALAPLFGELAVRQRDRAHLYDRSVATPTGKPRSAMTIIHARDRLAVV